MTHDFKPQIEKTGTEIAKFILEEINKNKDILVYEDKERSPEEVKEMEEKQTDFAISIFKHICTTDIPADYASYPLDKLIAVFSILKNYVDGSLRQLSDETMSRFFGIKSPETGKFRREMATMADVFRKLQEVRDATGNDMNDYFTVNKPEEGTSE